MNPGTWRYGSISPPSPQLIDAGFGVRIDGLKPSLPWRVVWQGVHWARNQQIAGLQPAEPVVEVLRTPQIREHPIELRRADPVPQKAASSVVAHILGVNGPNRVAAPQGPVQVGSPDSRAATARDTPRAPRASA